MSMLGARQDQLNKLCSSLFDEMGLPDHDAIQELERFLKVDSLKGINIDATIKTSIPNICTVFEAIRALTLHDYFQPLMTICRKFPHKRDFEFLDANIYIKLNALEKAKSPSTTNPVPALSAPIPALTPARTAARERTKAPAGSQKDVLNPVIYNIIADQIDKALMGVILTDNPIKNPSFKKKK
ncbi:MAG: hypothetical protein JSR17_01725 [Proteobacteria bacterium]|nr:hypothetical protein [Pseudomonadota bacterium]